MGGVLHGVKISFFEGVLFIYMFKYMFKYMFRNSVTIGIKGFFGRYKNNFEVYKNIFEVYKNLYLFL